MARTCRPDGWGESDNPPKFSIENCWGAIRLNWFYNIHILFNLIGFNIQGEIFTKFGHLLKFYCLVTRLCFNFIKNVIKYMIYNINWKKKGYNRQTLGLAVHHYASIPIVPNLQLQVDEQVWCSHSCLHLPGH